jgi:hypothetical protein
MKSVIQQLDDNVFGIDDVFNLDPRLMGVRYWGDDINNCPHRTIGRL